MVLNASYKDDNIIVLMLPDFLQKENKDQEAATVWARPSLRCE